jgi:hypothetical protein
VVVLALMLVSTAYCTYRITHYADQGGGFGGAPALASLEHRLRAATDQHRDAERHDHAPFWVAWRLAFESNEDIVAIPSDFGAQYPPYRRAVNAANPSAWVFYADGSAQHFARDREAEGATVRTEHAGAYDVVVVTRDRR